MNLNEPRGFLKKQADRAKETENEYEKEGGRDVNRIVHFNSGQQISNLLMPVHADVDFGLGIATSVPG